jgi:arylsulfatase A-like enzyme
MKNINFDTKLYLMLLSLVFGITFSQPKKANTKKPNVIVILTDDMGFSDIGCFGSEIKTPNIDKLAANGISFTHFYNTARCSPSRASLMTGLYPHQAGMGFLSNYNFDEEGYVDDLSKKAVTLAEVFKQADYATYMSGKWHMNKEKSIPNDRSNWPLQRGFDRFFGMLIGSGSFYDPGTLMRDNTFIAPGKDFYLTYAITDNVVRFIDENPKDKPFFFYIAYTAAHWPLHAPESEIQKYKGVYDKGWDETRKLRFEKLKKLGIISNKAVLTERGVDIPEWKDEPLKDWQVRRMEVYAAMVDIMDQGIGKIISTLEKKGELENTVIFYMHDNGGCAETLNSNEAEIPITDEQKKGKPFAKDSIFLGKIPAYTRNGEFIRSGKGVMPGPANTWTAYGEEWANVSNTPFRLYKHFVHEGGIATPLIIHWPEGIKAKGKLRTQPGHLIDIMATCVEIAGLQYPSNFNGNSIHPLEGKSLVPAFTNKSINREFIFWEHEGNRALRMGNWKLVSKTKKQKKFTPADENAWELYDMEEDPSEINNLALKYPDKVKTMAAIWEKEAQRTMAKPWPWYSK